MAGFNIGGRYMLNGFMGTAQEHAARAAQAVRDKAAADAKARSTSGYSDSAPSAGAATTAATQVQNANTGLDFTADPTGRTTVSNQSEQARMLAEQNARFATEADDRRRQQQIADRQELLKLIEQSTSRGSAATVTHPGVGGGEDARAAAFSRAKDAAGKIARASMTSIAEEMAGRGLSGSGIESLREAGALDATAGGLTEVARDQAIADAERAGQVNDLSYQGGITQRGQDLSQRESYLALLRSIYNY